jgi:hypothetical protein
MNAELPGARRSGAVGRKRTGRKRRVMNLFASDEEWAQVKAYCEKTGRKMAVIAREALFAEAGVPPRPEPPKAERGDVEE